MISVRFDNESKVTVPDAINISDNAIILKYPCSTSDCTPYAVTFKPGMYKIELWGASGGYLNSYGAAGSYTCGFLPIFRQKTFYTFLGQHGEWCGPATYNGGGNGTTDFKDVTDHATVGAGGSGGGSSDLRLINGPWNNFESLKSRIIVAAGGAGHAYYSATVPGGAGGTLQGVGGGMRSEGTYKPLAYATGGTQTSGGLGTSNPIGNGGFGFGGDSPNNYHGSGGGSGYYGGGSGYFTSSRISSGAGGSSYVSGYEGCKAITKNSTSKKIYHEESSIHYSGITLFSPTMIDGKSSMPCPNSTNSCFETGHYGHGYARITIYDRFNTITIVECHPWLSFSSSSTFIMLFSDKIKSSN